MNKDIVIIGAGLTGLTTAFYLKKMNKDFIVLEQNDKPGGVINTISKDGFTFEKGPNTGVVGNKYVVQLFDDLKGKCKIEYANKNVSKRYILKNNKWYALPQSLFQAIKTPLFTTRDKFRVLGEPFRAKGNNPNESLASMVKRRMGKSFLDYAIDPFILGVYAGDPNKLIHRFALPKLYNLENKYGSLVRGAIKKKKENKDELEKRVSKKVFSAKGGLSSITKVLYESSGIDNYIFNAKTLSITKNKDSYIINYEDNKTIIANKIVLACSSYNFSKLLPFVDNKLLDKINNVKYAEVIEVSLGFDIWEGINLDGFGGLIPFKENKNCLGILYMSALFDNRAQKNGALFSIFLGGVRNPDVINVDDSEVIEIIKNELMPLMEIKNFTPNLIDISRYKKAIPQYGIETEERYKAINEFEKQHKNILIGGNCKDGIGMADRIRQGYLMAKSI